jgi:phosphatidylcholine synthase
VTSASGREPSPGRVALAWGVHAFTASGAVVGTVALVAIVSADYRSAVLLMLIALTIDAVDGTLARRAEVARVLPAVDGRRLDDIVDFANYVLVPAVFLVATGALSHWAWAVLPVLASAYGFSQSAAKTDDDFFLGFPSYWNVIAIYIWLLEIPPPIATATVALFAALVFVPIKYIYPSKMPVLRRTTAALALACIALVTFAVLNRQTAESLHLVEISLLFPAYYLVVSWRVGGLHRAGG